MTEKSFAENPKQKESRVTAGKLIYIIQFVINWISLVTGQSIESIADIITNALMKDANSNPDITLKRAFEIGKEALEKENIIQGQTGIRAQIKRTTGGQLNITNR